LPNVRALYAKRTQIPGGSILLLAHFGGLTVENTPSSGQIQALHHIYFPATGAGYLLNWSSYGMPYSVSKQRQMTISGGVISDGVQSASLSLNYPVTASSALSDAPAFSQRIETPGGTYSYSASTNPSAQTITLSILRPDSSTVALTRSTSSASTANGLLVQSQITSGSATLSTVVNTYAPDGSGAPQIQSRTYYDDAGNPAMVGFSYDQYGNVTDKREYGYPVNGVFGVIRRTHTIYETGSTYVSLFLLSFPIEADVYNGLGDNNDSNDVLVAKTTYTLDNYAADGGMVDNSSPPAPGWNDFYTTSMTTRANVTGKTKWTNLSNNSSETFLTQYDNYGNVISQQLSCCNQKTSTYQSTDYYTNPQQVTEGNPGAMHLSGNYTYDFNTGLPTQFVLANGQGLLNYSYDAALRLARLQYPTGMLDTRSYNDGALSATFAKTGLGSTTVTYDGWGRTVQTVDPNNGQVNIGYDALGRLQSRTNPVTAGGQLGAATTFAYDALGRVTVTTFPDGSTRQRAYSGSTVTFTDPVGRQTEEVNDGLGRLVTVFEPSATGSLTQETDYTYNLLDKLTSVSQGGQTRASSFDNAGRLTYERIPEQTATINDGAGTLWTSAYTYTDFDAVATKTEATGAVKTYTYDALNRLVVVTYNTSSAPGVASTPGLFFAYDPSSTSATAGLLLSVGLNDESYSESYNYDFVDRVSSVTRTIGTASTGGSESYTTSYQYDGASQITNLTYPSGRSVTVGYDSVGRPNSIRDATPATYLSAARYDAAGRATAMTFGNGVSESLSFDPQRMQLTSETARVGSTSLLNLTYNYNSAAGANGPGTIAGNAGEVMSISGTLAGQTESANYTYDLWGRLATSSQVSNGASAARQFAYDRWGNRTGVWNAASGGSQIQSVAFQQSGSAPTNQIASVTTGAVQSNYTYDAAGNVTYDGVHSYQYDAESRLVAVDGGATAQYFYDGRSRRTIKIASGATTHYIWEGNEVLAEHNGSTGAFVVDYILYAGGFIAKVNASSTVGADYFLKDKLSERLRLDANGNVLGVLGALPFGEDFAESGQQESHHFTTYERDAETGQDEAIHRYYSSATGRFTRPDPYAGSARLSSPQSWNRYVYCKDDPVNSIDPYGLFCGPGTIPVTGPNGQTICVPTGPPDQGGDEGGGGSMGLPTHPPLEGGGGGGGGDTACSNARSAYAAAWSALQNAFTTFENDAKNIAKQSGQLDAFNNNFYGPLQKAGNAMLNGGAANTTLAGQLAGQLGNILTNAVGKYKQAIDDIKTLAGLMNLRFRSTSRGPSTRRRRWVRHAMITAPKTFSNKRKVSVTRSGRR
jgi:RHS repeat-associated protein